MLGGELDNWDIDPGKVTQPNVHGSLVKGLGSLQIQNSYHAGVGFNLYEG